MNRVFALVIDPDGTWDELSSPEGEITAQHQALHTNLGKGYTTTAIGRFLVHWPDTPYDQETNRAAQQLWSGLSGGSPAPFFRGTVIVTARRRPDGSYSGLLPAQLDRLHDNVGEHPWKPQTAPVISTSQEKGTRAQQCDAAAVHTDAATGVWAFALCDGVGDHIETGLLVEHFAPRLARTAAETGDPGAAIHAARAELAHWQMNWCVEEEPTAAVVVAVWDPRRKELLIAWAGDCRAYAMSATGLVTQLTADHNLAAYKASRKMITGPDDHHQLLSHMGEGPVEEMCVHLDRVRRLLLCSDGVYHPIEAASWSGVSTSFALLEPKSAAGRLVVDAVAEAVARSRAECGRLEADNATALVVDFPGL
ncbi:SpoIIE family protein phosphatase [Kitasatospora sp. NBC_01287]|uniref:PP2C family protein-serine/threonine phosphatase n=1 Tax=Kitasatospora sp. NBC_01287 TaxID=2903573 RepID=UPI00225802BD|nr:SpoIIE family protein phosphatase [Kitasatospora sp. NBC_01287]MCX4749269.1 SpoIIE family protein phosphatase [Kitasatospora sp. NBC_01287]